VFALLLVLLAQAHHADSATFTRPVQGVGAAYLSGGNPCLIPQQYGNQYKLCHYREYAGKSP
jgi:hypothetical protein